MRYALCSSFEQYTAASGYDAPATPGVGSLLVYNVGAYITPSSLDYYGPFYDTLSLDKSLDAAQQGGSKTGYKVPMGFDSSPSMGLSPVRVIP